MSGDIPHEPVDATRTSIGAATLLKKDRLLADRYRIIAPVGVGGMGLVYRAHDERLDLDVALKILRPERAPDQAVLERFERELVLAREVSHPNVVRIHDIGQDGDLHFITMDLVEGRSLRDLLEDDGPMAVDEAVRIATDIAEGLDAAHNKGVIHRDLKPANILLDNDGHAYISDFGVARSLHASNLTSTGMIVGSPDYLAPEQARGEAIDGRTDIYALGLILYEMLSGQLPFRSGTIEEMIAQRTVGQARDIAKTGAKAPAWLRRIVYRCLQKDPDDRFATAAELAQDLRSHSAPALRMPRITRRTAWLGALLVALVAVVFVGQRFTGDTKSARTLRVAVLPMANDTGNPQLDWLAAGVSDMLDTHFLEHPGIEIIDTSRVVDTLTDLHLDADKLDDRTMPRLAELLSADRIVTGAIRRAGDGLRIDASVRRVDGGRPRAVVAQTSDASPHTLVDEFAATVGDVLSVQTPLDAQIVLSSSTAALEAYVQGRAALRQADTGAAIPFLEAAVAADPGFAVAWFHLADAYDLAGYSDRAERAIRQAAEQAGDQDTRVGLQAQALQASFAGDFETSQTLLTRLIQRFPSDIPARMALAEAYGDEGRFDEAGSILQSVVQADANHPRAWFLLGKYAIQSGDSRRAIDDYLVRDLVIQNRLDNDQGRANVLNAMGIAYGRIGQIETARENYEKAAELRQKIGDRRGMATSLNNLASLEMMSGNYAAARTRLEQAKQVSLELGDQAGLAAFINTIGTLEEETGDYASALKEYRDALKLREALGDRRALTESYNNVGFAYYMLGELDNARLYWERALAESRDLGNRDAEMQALQSLGLLHTAGGEWGEGLKAFLEALTISRELDSPEAEAVSVGNMGHIAALQGRYATALTQLDEALTILEPVGDTRGLTEFGLRRADVFALMGLRERVPAQLKIVEQWLSESPNLEQQSEFLRLSAMAVSDKQGEAEEILRRAITVAEQSGSVAAVMRVRLALAQQALEKQAYQGAHDEAARIAQQAGRTGLATLQIQALAIEARAAVAIGSAETAIGPVNAVLDLLDRHLPFGDAYRIRVFAAEVFSASGREALAARQQSLAAAEVDRVRDNLPAMALDFFNSQPDVSRLREEALVDGN